MDVAALERLVAAKALGRFPLIMLTVTNNSGGGQPVSMVNIEAVKQIASQHGIPLYLDACRFAENSFFIRQREPGYAHFTPKTDRSKNVLGWPTAAPFRPRKTPSPTSADLLCSNDDRVAMLETNILILTEGFPTYGGLAGRDLEAIAVGLEEILDPDYLQYRIVSTNYLGRHIADAGVPIVEPPGGHAIYIDAARMLPHIRAASSRRRPWRSSCIATPESAPWKSAR